MNVSLIHYARTERLDDRISRVRLSGLEVCRAWRQFAMGGDGAVVQRAAQSEGLRGC